MMGFIIVLDVVLMVMPFLFCARTEGWNLWKRLNGWLKWLVQLTYLVVLRKILRHHANAKPLDILEETTLFFEAALRSEGGRNATRYLKQRGLKSDIVKTYRIGYSPRNGLRRRCGSKVF